MANPPRRAERPCPKSSKLRSPAHSSPSPESEAFVGLAATVAPDSDPGARGGPRLLTGRVQSGHGDAARWLRTFNSAYSRKLGVPVYPGSLNLALAQPFGWAEPALQADLIRFDREEYGGERDILLLPCRLRSLGGEAAFLWTTTTAAHDPEDPWVVEVVASLGLRATYGLKDGDLVTLQLPPFR